MLSLSLTELKRKPVFRPGRDRAPTSMLTERAYIQAIMRELADA